MNAPWRSTVLVVALITVLAACSSDSAETTTADDSVAEVSVLTQPSTANQDDIAATMDAALCSGVISASLQVQAEAPSNPSAFLFPPSEDEELGPELCPDDFDPVDRGASSLEDAFCLGFAFTWLLNSTALQDDAPEGAFELLNDFCLERTFRGLSAPGPETIEYEIFTSGGVCYPVDSPVVKLARHPSQAGMETWQYVCGDESSEPRGQVTDSSVVGGVADAGQVAEVFIPTIREAIASTKYSSLRDDELVDLALVYCGEVRNGAPDELAVMSVEMRVLEEYGGGRTSDELALVGTTIGAGVSAFCPEVAADLGLVTPPIDPVPVESAEEAFCAGALYALTELGDDLKGTDFEDLLPSGREPAGPEFLACVEGVHGEIDASVEFSSAYVAGCAGPFAAWAAKTSEDPTLDDSFFQAVGEKACGDLFDGVLKYEIRRDGVCYYLDFEPSEEQIEGGYRPCD